MATLLLLSLLTGSLGPGSGGSPPACPASCKCSPASSIYCNRTGLRSLPKELAASTISLNLSNNFLRLLTADAFSNLTLLNSLWLDHNNLTFLYPGAFKSLCNLRVLQLSRNPRLTYLHANTFQGLANLISLDLSHCNLFEIHPFVFTHLPSLEALDLTANNMRYLPQAFRSLTGLTRLSLERNRIEAIGRDSLKDMEALKELNLRRNRIWTIQKDAFLPLDQLGVLNLGHNRLSDLPNQLFAGLTQLKTMHLEANRLTRIGCPFSSLRSLRKLYLNNNRIFSVDGSAFSHLGELNFLHLSRNNLSHLPSRLLAGLPKLRFVLLAHNPWPCDCTMLWFATWVLTYQGVVEGPQCASLALGNRSFPSHRAQDALPSCPPPSEPAEEDDCSSARQNGAAQPPGLSETLGGLLLSWGARTCLAAFSFHRGPAGAVQLH
ncbi:Nyctalopin [Varanus komodoensis]|uniref:nyctalopin-like n=1 Tax=Varanus komodoensis TaxID=61221 RepID=UPI001CF7B5EA|nr:nyctalopin-like [Varanus komodoensis]KAF7237441.1 Nyctalopin [Varanus komodoensis]